MQWIPSHPDARIAGPQATAMRNISVGFSCIEDFLSQPNLPTFRRQCLSRTCANSLGNGIIGNGMSRFASLGRSWGYYKCALLSCPLWMPLRALASQKRPWTPPASLKDPG